MNIIKKWLPLIATISLMWYFRFNTVYVFIIAGLYYLRLYLNRHKNEIVIPVPPSGEVIVYDKAKWHYEAENFNNEDENFGGSHISFIATWLGLNGFLTNEELEGIELTVLELREQKITPIKFLMEYLAETLNSDYVNKEAQAFLYYYYSFENSQFNYFKDYTEFFVLKGGDNYVIEGTWENYFKVESMIQSRYSEFLELSK